MMTTNSTLAAAALLTLAWGCSSKVTVLPAPDAGADAQTQTPTPTPPTAHDADAGGSDPGSVQDSGPPPDPLAGCMLDPGAPKLAVDAGAAEDPVGAANFTLMQALAGFTATGKLYAKITTEKSAIGCELLEKDAPVAVANFVGLARGTRPYYDRSLNIWKTGHFYDGLTWHRVIPGFVIQGGDPDGDGTGGPGYDLPQENHKAELLGTLAMAAGTAPSGSQFFIVIGKGPAADYNVFGKCTTAVAIEIAKVERNAADKPKVPIHMQKVEIARCP